MVKYITGLALLLVSAPISFSWQTLTLAPRGSSARGRTGLAACVCRARGESAQTPFLPKINHPAAFADDAAFAAWPACNDGETQTLLGVGARTRIGEPMLTHLDDSGAKTPMAALARELAKTGAVDSKEFFEAAEFYHRVRRRVRRATVVDLACGHGLTGIMFAALERTVSRVVLVDSRRPASFDLILAAAVRVAPWTADKVQFCEADLFAEAGASKSVLPFDIAAPGDQHGCVAVHACGLATDRCLEIATLLGGPMALMPCCYSGATKEVPFALRRALGKSLAADIDRTYRLHAAGYHVDWATIPRAITPMNRIIIATPRGVAVGS
ncbi:hypothetical protein T484DRAFT_1934118 [Baffinella frigidus]|nr:hypothetical protein T484DRAFT_1934118 [Cryptophyta sp. CCMP2293]